MSGEEPAPQMAPMKSPQMISTIKLPMLKKVIINGDEPVQTTKDENGVETKVPWKRISDKRTKNQVKNDKTEHGMEKRGKDKVKSKPKTKKVKVKSQPAKVNSQNRADIEEYLMGPPEPI
ncbi:hypothetical protein Tco_0935774 [Tanacetum coccineum]